MKLPRPKSAHAAALLLALLNVESSAANLTWDITSGNGTTIDAGGGNWTLSDITWNNAGSDTTWTQTDSTTATNSAIFAGADGTADSYAVNIASQVATQGLTFNSTGYNLSGSPIYIGIAGGNGAHAPIVVSANKTATISSQVIGNVVNTSTTAASVTINAGGNLTLSGGAENMRYTFGGNGTLNIAGGTYNMTGVYQVNNAVVNHTAGTVNLLGTGLSNIGQTNNVNTLYTLSGSGVIASTVTSVVIGRTSSGNATNTFIIKDGGQFTLGNASNSTARLNLTGGVINNSSSNVLVDVQDGGTFSVANTTAVNSLAFYPNGAQTGKSLTFKVSGGNASVSGVQFGTNNASLNWAATSNLQVTSGNLYIGSGGISRPVGAAALAVNIQLQGGTLGAQANWSTPLDIKIGANATIQAASLLGTARTISLTGNLLDDTSLGNLTKTGNGTLALSGNSTYTGLTTVNAGTLAFRKKTAKPSGNTTVSAGANVSFGLHDTDITAYSAAEIAGFFNNPSSTGITLDSTSGIGFDVDSTTGTANQTITLTGGSNLAKTGNGTLNLTINNSYTGETIATEGDLVLQNAGALGSTAGGTTVTSGASVSLDGVTVTGESASIAGGGVSNTGALRGKSGSSLWTGPVTISGNSTRIGTLADSTFEVSGPIGDGVNEYQVIYRPADSPTAILIISGNNTYKGNSTVANGLVQISSFNSVVGGSPSSSLGAPTTALTGIINFGILAGHGNLRYVGPGETTDRTIQVGNGEAVTATGNANIEHNGSGALVFTAPNFNIPAIANTPRVLTLKGSNADANRVSGIIQDNTTSGLGAATISLQKDGTGSWSLEGANTYSGSTTVSAGTLTLGASGTLPDATPVTIGTATLNATASGIETAGTLAVTGAAVINLSPGAQLAFADSSGVSWTGPSLNITGSFVSGSSLRFASSNSSLSSGQLAIISINGTQTGNCTLDSNGFLTAPGAVDSTPPVITRNGSASVSVDWGSTYTDLGASATDETAPANPSVSTSNPVNTSIPGTYTVSYNASDLAGNPATTVTRTVTVSIANPTTVGADGLSPLARYAFGANNPTESVEAPVITATASTLVLTAVVRTDDPKLSVIGQAVDDLAGTWGTGGAVAVTTSASQVGVPTNCVRRDFTVSTVGSSKKFLRLNVTLAP